MINRDNWKLTKEYLRYRADILQNDNKTIRSGKVVLAHVLYWADSVPFADVHKIRPTLPDYLLTVRRDGKAEKLSPAHMAKVLTWARALFEWLRVSHPSSYRALSPAWIESLKLRRSASIQSRLPVRQFWTLEDARRVIAYQPDTLRKQRDRAALCFIFLSGIRGGAFVTLPVRSVDLEHRRVYQLPEWGVQTKNSKAAVTYLLPIPDLLDVVKEWDTFVKSRAKSESVAWYASMDNLGTNIVQNDVVQNVSVAGRRAAMYQGMRELCEIVGIEWKSPHKIRHGHGVYGVKHAKTMAEYRALSQNMMHESTNTTDKYTGFLNDEVGDIISTFKDE